MRQIAGALNLTAKEENAVQRKTKVNLVDKVDENLLESQITNMDTSNGDKQAAKYTIENFFKEKGGSFEKKDANNYEITENEKNDKINLKRILYGKNSEHWETLYYTVTLTGKAEHLFKIMEKFGEMNIKAVAVAKISANSIVETFEGIAAKNVIFGNWEVQNYYRQKDRRAAYKEIFGKDFYTGAFNVFADTASHYKQGDVYRTETINIFDDVSLNDESKTGDARYAVGNVNFGSNSSVQGKSNSTTNDVAINNSDEKSYTYNTTGNPYVAEDLDSIDVDFWWDIGFSTNSVYRSKDWDLELGYDSGWYHIDGNKKDHWSGYDNDTRSGVGVGAIKNQKYGWINHARIHSEINFNKPYPKRKRVTENDPNNPDILWVRIESESMLRYPDNPADPNNEKHLNMRVYNSVRQIIINFNASNAGQNDRPLVIFYDGPERYTTDNHLRDSKPVIVNLNADFNGILYMPNSPVVFNGNEKNFRGFIVAKKYLRLKTTQDFENELLENPTKYTRDGENFQKTEAEDNPYYGDFYGTIPRATGEPEKINWTYTKIMESGLEMYVDDYGNVQYMEIENPPTKYGNYDTFRITELTDYNYNVQSTSSDNLLIS